MSTSMLNIKSEEIDTVGKREKYRVSIIGSRQNGVLHACLFAEAGFKVTCVDVNRVIVGRIMEGSPPFSPGKAKSWLKRNVRNGKLKATNDIKEAVSESDVIVIICPVKIDKRRRIDHLELQRVCKQVGLALPQGSLVIVMSTVRPGTTEGLISETFENVSGLKIGYHFGLAYSPIPFLKQNSLEELMTRKRIVAAKDRNSLEAASTILETITQNGVATTNNVKAAEATRLFKSIQHYVNIALANELALLCEKDDMDYFQIKKLARTDSAGMFAQPSVSCENIREEPRLLLEEAENLNAKLRIPTTAIGVNRRILKHAVDLIKEALRSCGKSLRTAKISFVGISRTRNAKDIPKSSTRKLAETLEAKGCKVSLYDPYLTGKKLIDLGYRFHRRLGDAMKGVDCIVILTGHSRLRRLSLEKFKVLGRMPAAVVDLEGILEPEKVEAKGLTYRGLGRGVRKE